MTDKKDWHASVYNAKPSTDSWGYCVVDVKTGEVVADRIPGIEMAQTIAELLSIQWETNDQLERVRRMHKHPAFKRKRDQNENPFA